MAKLRQQLKDCELSKDDLQKQLRLQVGLTVHTTAIIIHARAICHIKAINFEENSHNMLMFLDCRKRSTTVLFAPTKRR